MASFPPPAAWLSQKKHQRCLCLGHLPASSSIHRCVCSLKNGKWTFEFVNSFTWLVTSLHSDLFPTFWPVPGPFSWLASCSSTCSIMFLVLLSDPVERICNGKAHSNQRSCASKTSICALYSCQLCISLSPEFCNVQCPPQRRSHVKAPQTHLVPSLSFPHHPSGSFSPSLSPSLPPSD